MLASAETIRVVAAALREHNVAFMVIDPVRWLSEDPLPNMVLR